MVLSLIREKRTVFDMKFQKDHSFQTQRATEERCTQAWRVFWGWLVCVHTVEKEMHCSVEGRVLWVPQADPQQAAPPTL